MERESKLNKNLIVTKKIRKDWKKGEGDRKCV
jgi:hypothetical protein